MGPPAGTHNRPGSRDAILLQRLTGHSMPAIASPYMHIAAGSLAKLHRSVSPLDPIEYAAGSRSAAPDSRCKRLR